MWQRNSPDLNPVDYAIWSVIQLNAVCNIQRVHFVSEMTNNVEWDVKLY